MAWLALLAQLAAASTESAPLVDAEDLGPSQQVQAMLDARADALAAGDVEGYLEPLDPAAREVEEPIAEQAVRVPLSEIRLRLRDPAFTRRGVDGDETMVASHAKVDVVFAYEGIPEDNRFSFRLRSDLEERDGAWRVTGTQVVIPDMDSPEPMPPMWALGPVEVARSEHFLALHRPGLEDPDSVLAVAEEARAELLPKLTLEPAPAHVLQIAATDEEYGQILDPTVAHRSVAVAVSSSTGARYARSRVPQNRHVTANLAAIFAGSLPPELAADPHASDGHAGDQPPDGPQDHYFEPEVSPREVFQHELGHLALSRFDRSSTPIWVREGGAMQLSGEQRTRSWQAGLAAGTFAGMSFRDLAHTDPTVGLEPMEYAYVNAAVSYLVAEFGAERFWEFYRDFKELDMGSSGNPLEQVHADGTNRLLWRVYDLGEDDLDERTLAWMRQALQ